MPGSSPAVSSPHAGSDSSPVYDSEGQEVMDAYDNFYVYERKFEVDSLAAFLRLSYEYLIRFGFPSDDATFMSRWPAAV